MPDIYIVNSLILIAQMISKQREFLKNWVLQEEFHINFLLLVEKTTCYYKLGTQDLHGKFHFISDNTSACNSAQLILFIVAPDQTSSGLIF